MITLNILVNNSKIVRIFVVTSESSLVDCMEFFIRFIIKKASVLRELSFHFLL